MDCLAALAMTFVVIPSHCEKRSDEAIHDFLIVQESYFYKKLDNFILFYIIIDIANKSKAQYKANALFQQTPK